METDYTEKCIIHLNSLQDEEKRKKKKFKLEMHENQVFKDGEEVSGSGRGQRGTRGTSRHVSRVAKFSQKVGSRRTTKI